MFTIVELDLVQAAAPSVSVQFASKITMGWLMDESTPAAALVPARNDMDVDAPVPRARFCPTILLLTAAPVLLIYGGLLLCRLFGRRLSHVPGPWSCKITSLHLAVFDLSCQRNDQILKWHRRYGPVVCIAPNEVSVATLEATREIYSATNAWEKSNYFDHFTGYSARSIFAAKSPREHREKRKLTSAFYQPSTICKLPEIEQRIEDGARAVAAQIRHNEDVDIYALADRYALDNITALVLGPSHGTQCVSSAAGAEQTLLHELKRRQFVGPFSIRFPRTYWCLSQVLGRLLPSQLGYLLVDSKFAAWSLDRMSAALSDPLLPNSHSLLRRLLHHPDSATLDRAFIAAEVLDNINAAEATVAVTATYLVWRLSQHPVWQHRIRAELRALPASPAFADINTRVPSLEACLREVYRLHPASSGRAERLVPKGGRVLCGVALPEGTIVSASVVALHRDECLFPHPEEFRPERWLPSRSYTGSGSGTGTCDSGSIPADTCTSDSDSTSSPSSTSDSTSDCDSDSTSPLSLSSSSSSTSPNATDEADTTYKAEKAEEALLKSRNAQLIPFGYGGRICLGQALATMEIKKLIAELYGRFETRVVDGLSDEREMKQCSTHDAVPRGLRCVVRFRRVAGGEEGGKGVRN